MCFKCALNHPECIAHNVTSFWALLYKKTLRSKLEKLSLNISLSLKLFKLTEIQVTPKFKLHHFYSMAWQLQNSVVTGLTFLHVQHKGTELIFLREFQSMTAQHAEVFQMPWNVGITVTDKILIRLSARSDVQGKKMEDFSYALCIFYLNSKNWDMSPDALYLLQTALCQCLPFPSVPRKLLLPVLEILI